MSDLSQLARDMGIELGTLGIQGVEPTKVVEQTAAQLRETRDDNARQQLAVLNVLARAIARMPANVGAETVHAVMQWWPTNQRGMLLVVALASANPAFLEQFVDNVIELDDQVAFVVGAAGFLAEGVRVRMWTRLATDPRDGVRQHFFALLGRHKRLVPPGSLAKPKMAISALTDVLAAGLHDSNATVRERAAAATYGLGLSDELRDVLLKLAHDDSSDVRQYALVSLGVMRDSQSLALLQERLDHGAQPEVTSAIWAMSRRPDGIDSVLRLAGTHGWLDDELLGAFAEVAVPLSDEQIAELEGRTSAPAFESLKQRHLDRTRGGAPEYGPDGRIRWE